MTVGQKDELDESIGGIRMEALPWFPLIPLPFSWLAGINSVLTVLIMITCGLFGLIILWSVIVVGEPGIQKAKDDLFVSVFLLGLVLAVYLFGLWLVFITIFFLIVRMLYLIARKLYLVATVPAEKEW